MSRKREWGRRRSDNQAYPKIKPDKSSLPSGLNVVVPKRGKVKEFTVVDWMTICPYCGEATGTKPTNAGYYLCPECRKWSYNAEYDAFKEPVVVPVGGKEVLTLEEETLLESIRESGSILDTPECLEHKALLGLERKGLIYTEGEIRPHHIIRWRLTDERPRVFYRGTVPESRKQIRTGDDYWDNRLFVSSSRELALSYGPNIERILPTEDARILYEGTGDFTRVAGHYNPRKENYLSYLSRALKSAEGLGYDAVHFERQGDVGTAIINPEKFIREG